MLAGNTIYLRILEETDLEKTIAWINDPEISEIMGYLPVKSKTAQLNWYKSIDGDPSRYIFAICLNQTNEHIGNVGLGNIDYINSHCMFNIFIAQKENRSNGIGTEATKLALSFAFNQLNLNKVYLRTSERFISANKMYIKMGFVRDGVLREHYFTNGKYEDKILYSILRKEYEK